jgi:hypothetical protein
MILRHSNVTGSPILNSILGNGAIGLDEQNQAAIMALLDGARGEYEGTSMDVMRGLLLGGVNCVL